MYTIFIQSKTFLNRNPKKGAQGRSLNVDVIATTAMKRKNFADKLNFQVGEFGSRKGRKPGREPVGFFTDVCKGLPSFLLYEFYFCMSFNYCSLFSKALRHSSKPNISRDKHVQILRQCTQKSPHSEADNSLKLNPSVLSFPLQSFFNTISDNYKTVLVSERLIFHREHVAQVKHILLCNAGCRGQEKMEGKRAEKEFGKQSAGAAPQTAESQWC